MSLEALKAIPCPAGHKCTAFRCLFSHPQEQAESQAPASTSPGDGVVSDDGGGDGPKKRLRTGEAGQAVSSAAVPPPNPLGRAPSTQEKQMQGSGVSLPLKRSAPGEGTAKQGGRPPGPDPSSNIPPSSNVPPSSPPFSSASSTHLAGLSTPSAAVPPPTSTSLLSPTTSKTAPPAARAATAIAVSTSAAAPPKPPPKTARPEALIPRPLKSGVVTARHDTRYKLLKMLHHELVRLNDELKKQSTDQALLLTEQGLVTRARDEEERIATVKAAVYTNAIKLRIVQLRRMKVSQWVDERLADRPRSSSTSAPPARQPKEIKTGLVPSQEVDLLRRRLITSLSGLGQHGYVTAAPSDDDIEKARMGVDASKGWEKCERCDKRFQVFPGRRADDGALATGGACTHHSGRAVFPARTPGDAAGPRPVGPAAKRWTCCGTSPGESTGCTKSPHHVFKVTDPKRLSVVLPFADTPENESVPADRAVCFDCEMAYTVHGLELVRITATAWPGGETLLDVLVRPVGEVLDLNSRYSGVWPEDMASAELWTSEELPPAPAPAIVPKSVNAAADTAASAATAATPDTAASATAAAATPKPRMKMVPSPRAARALLFALLSPSTPLIGHGLENDLNATRIIHPVVVDTVLLYPHRAGLPMRHGLKHLTDQHLNRVIQSSADKGHDSAEDARAAGDLVRLKVGEQWALLQTMGWAADEKTGELLDPGQIREREGAGAQVDKVKAGASGPLMVAGPKGAAAA